MGTSWLKRSAQFSELHDELSNAQDALSRDDISYLKREVGDIPEQTCPLIDSVIKQINSVIRTAKQGVQYENPSDAFDEIEMELWDTEDILENIRKHNNQLRSLGAYWYAQYVSMEEKIKELESHLQHCRNMCNKG